MNMNRAKYCFSCVTKDAGFYQDKSLGAAVMVTCEKHEHTPCARTLVGMIYLSYLKYIEEMFNERLLQTNEI